MHDAIVDLVKSEAIEFEEAVITLVSNDPGKSFRIAKSRLADSIGYFRILFDSDFADSETSQFQIVSIPGVTYLIEQLLFSCDDALDRSKVSWLSEVEPRPTPRQLVLLYRLSSYYDTDLSASILHALESQWENERNFTGPKLEALLKAFRALQVEAPDDIQQFTNRHFEQLMRYNHPALVAAHGMSEYEQVRFWPQLLDFCSKRKRWPGMVIPYFRVLQSCPVRPRQPQDLVEEELVKVLNEEHFVEMKSHRESNGHQYGDFALHPASLIQKFSLQQLVWCWRSWSNSEGEKREEDEGHQCLLRRLRQYWPSLVLMPQDYGMMEEERGILAAELYKGERSAT